MKKRYCERCKTEWMFDEVVYNKGRYQYQVLECQNCGWQKAIGKTLITPQDEELLARRWRTRG